MKGFTYSHKNPKVPKSCALVDVVTPVQFTSLEPGATSHYWQFSDGTTSIEANPQKLFSTPGFYSVVYTAYKNEQQHKYMQKWCVRSYPNRATTPNRVFDLSAWNGTGVHHDFSNVPPGGVLKLTGQKSEAELLVLKNLKGTTANPIFITCDPGTYLAHYVTNKTRDAVMILNSCHHVIFDFANMKIEHGGLDMWNDCTDIEWGGLQCGFGRAAGLKGKWDGDPNGRNSDFHANIIIHSCDMDSYGTEGTYIGWSFYKKRINDTDYKNNIVGCKQFRNRAHNCGWDGFQLGSGDKDSELFANESINCARARKPAHANGQQINDGFKGLIYNNIARTFDSWGGSLQITPGFGAKIFNNVWDNVSAGYALHIRTEENDIPGAYLMHTDPLQEVDVFHNTMMSKDKAVYITHTGDEGTPVKINIYRQHNNLYTATTDLSVNSSPNNVIKGGNLKKALLEARFVDPAAGDYNLLPESPARGAGVAVVSLVDPWDPENYDIDGVFRAGAYDVGAYAYHEYFPVEGQPPLEIPSKRTRKMMMLLGK